MQVSEQTKFEKDVAAGTAGEILAADYLKWLGKDVAINPGTTLESRRRGDLIVNGVWVEVKTDFKACKTSNIVIEHQSLHTHTAPHYLYVIPYVYRISRENLQHLVDTWPDVVEIGDDKRAGTLIPLNSETFKQYFTRI